MFVLFCPVVLTILRVFPSSQLTVNVLDRLDQGLHRTATVVLCDVLKVDALENLIQLRDRLVQVAIVI